MGIYDTMTIIFRFWGKDNLIVSNILNVKWLHISAEIPIICNADIAYIPYFVREAPYDQMVNIDA